jgi:hypothetical protein
MSRPAETDYSPQHRGYVALVPEDDVLGVLEAQRAEFAALLRGVPEEKGGVRHAPYTWSVKEVVGHVTDAERVFGYRALRFARGDATPLPGFDENDYARAAESDRRPLAGLVAEFEALRRSHQLFFGNLPDAAWERAGEANGHRVSVRGLAYIMAGHARHHTVILRRRLSGG